ncbi:MAG: diaminopimelate decarboxylase [Verrucomicrobiota bacterium JB022]|nr:diaminopimelate decarboxylase [Verrucomicrobiota bacterium JB022]
MSDWQPFLGYSEARQLAEAHGTPVYVYDEQRLRAQAAKVLGFPHAFGLTARFAVKACPTLAVIELFHQLGLHFDASSGYEVQRLMRAGVPASHISLSTQELPDNFAEYVRQGLKVNACSLNQLERFGQAFPGGRVGLRVNPGLGSGHVNRTNVGGPASSFGVWHAQLDRAVEIAARHNLTIERLHSHIGSGTDPEVWERVVELNLEIVRRLPAVESVNLGGGYKVARIPSEKTTDLQVIGARVKGRFEAFAQETGRQLKLEVEPGTYLVATAGALLSRVQDIVDTGAEGYRFLKLDTGMTEILRPSLYGAQHRMELLTAEPRAAEADYILVGHCCESGDILTPAPGDAEALQPRRLPEAQVGDFVLIRDTGAYCAAMPSKNYNSFPEAPEVMCRSDGSFALVRRRQTLEQMLANEVSLA